MTRKILLFIFITFIAYSSKVIAGEGGYVIGVEDVLEVTMAWGNQTLSHTVTVPPDGEISLPMIANVQAKSLTLTQLKGSITERLNEFV